MTNLWFLILCLNKIIPNKEPKEDNIKLTQSNVYSLILRFL